MPYLSPKLNDVLFEDAQMIDFQPIMQAPLAVQIHVVTVVPAAIIGAFLLAMRKGTPVHRMAGKIWMVLMVVTSAASFFIHELNVFYGFSPIHAFSVIVPVSCFLAVRAVRAGNIRQHKLLLASTYIGGIGIAGGFAFAPGRIMNRVVIGGDSGSLFGTTPIWLVSLAAGLLLALVTAWIGRRMFREG